MIIALIVGAIAAVLLFWAIGAYNSLVALRNRYKNGFSQIDVQLTRRYDLIPNLVDSAKGYMAHEKGTLEAVIAARNLAQTAGKAAAANPSDSQAMIALGGAESALTGALTKFVALAESYPDLKANTNIQSLMEELSSTENKVGFARQAFNDAITAYNTAREQFPSVFIANLFSFLPAELLKIESEKMREAPKVSFH